MKYMPVGFLLLIWTISCETDAGKSFNNETQKGTIIVSVNNALQADIFLDYKKTGLKTTTDILNGIPVGRHVVHVMLAGHKSAPDSMVVDLDSAGTETIEFTLTPVPSGNLCVTTNPGWAMVSLNQVQLGYSDPGGLFTYNGLPAGTYNLRIQKNGFNETSRSITISGGAQANISETLSPSGRMALIEHFSNTSCNPCPPYDAVIEKVMLDYGVSKVMSIGYHTSYPSKYDPMYLEADTANLKRYDYYKAGSAYLVLPTIYLNGSEVPRELVTFEDSLRSRLALALQTSAPVMLDIRPAPRLLIDSLAGTVALRGISAVSGNVKLRMAIIERSVDFSQPPGTNGLKHFFDVLRGFYGDPDGIPINLAAGEEQSLAYAISKKPSWGSDICLVAFLQNDDTGAVLQSAWSVYP